MHCAAKNGHTSIVRLLLEHNADPRIKDDAGFTPLHYTAGNGQIEATELIVNRRPDVNARTNKGSVALHFAVSNRDAVTAKFLLANGASASACNDVGVTPLHNAAVAGNASITRLLLNHGAQSSIRDIDGTTLLHCSALINEESDVQATDAERAEVADLLLCHGADPSPKNNKGITPLHTAIYNGYSELAKLLIIRGADTLVADDCGNTPTSIARRTNDIAMLNHLIVSANISSPAQVSPQVTDVAKPTMSPVAPLNEALEELAGLTGLESVKSEIEQLTNYLRIQGMRKAKGLAIPQQSLHMVFTGNPGTGKTTVARLVAKIYQSLGVLSKGQFVETDRSGLVAAFLGQTAIKVQEVVQSAIGGVLFIDEAYSLAQTGIYGGDAYGREAVDTLLKLMEDHRDNLVVIVAGYTDKMSAFIGSNPGLESRFNRYINFADYSPAELTTIFSDRARKNDYSLTDDATLKVAQGFEKVFADRDDKFGNARLARNLFEKAVNNQATRVSRIQKPTDEDLVTILPDDIIFP